MCIKMERFWPKRVSVKIFEINMQNFTDVKLEIFIPQEYALQIRDELAKIGVGVIGDYDHCVAVSPVKGYFRPLDGTNPFE
jgi:hypothetical protein